MYATKLPKGASIGTYWFLLTRNALTVMAVETTHRTHNRSTAITVPISANTLIAYTDTDAYYITNIHNTFYIHNLLRLMTSYLLHLQTYCQLLYDTNEDLPYRRTINLFLDLTYYYRVTLILTLDLL